MSSEYFYVGYDGRAFPTEEMNRLQRALWDGARWHSKQHLVPDLLAGPYIRELPWPSEADFEHLAGQAQEEALWDFLETNRYENVYLKDTPVASYLHVMLAISASKDLSYPSTFMSRYARRRFHPLILLRGLKACCASTGPDTGCEVPPLAAVVAGYQRLVEANAPGPIVPLDAQRTAQLAPPGYSAVSLPDGPSFADDLVRLVDNPDWHLYYEGARGIHWENIGRELTTGPATHSPGSVLVFPRASPNPARGVHVLRLSEASGQSVLYCFLSIFYEIVGWLRLTEDQSAAGELQEKIAKLVSAQRPAYRALQTLARI